MLTGLEGFNRSVSHDLRGPLGNIANLSSLLIRAIERGDSAKAGEMARFIERQASEGVSLVEGLLLMARLGTIDLVCTQVDLRELVHALCADLKVESEKESLPISIGELPVAPVNAVLVRQLFRNLLTNALKFTRETPAPRIEVGSTVEPGETVFHVRDNGIGFSPDDAKRIFEPFAQVHGGAYRGSGIGLSIVQRIVASHGGWVTADGRPGSGACVRFTLATKRV